MDTILLLVAITSIFGGVMYSVHQMEQTKRKQWQKFAARNQLTFNPGIMLLGGGTISGRYQGYKVDLRSVTEEQKTYTQLSVTRNHKEPIEVVNDLTAYKKEKAFITLLLPDWIPHLEGNFEIRFGGSSATYKQEGFEGNLTKLETILKTNYQLVKNYPAIVALGAEAIPDLLPLTKTSVIDKVIYSLIEDITREATHLWENKRDLLICPQCLTKCTQQIVSLSWFKKIKYPACRQCGQSRHFLEVKFVVALLDNNQPEDIIHRGNILRINWLNKKKLFDFDGIEIAQATDKEVESLAMQVGNDMDPYRKKRYKDITCALKSSCQLSANTHRILKQTFGKVIITES